MEYSTKALNPKLIFKCSGCGDTSFKTFEEADFHSKKVCEADFPDIIIKEDKENENYKKKNI